MYRFLIVLALCGHLANATGWSRDTSLQDLVNNPFDRTSAGADRYGSVDKTREDYGGWPTYQEAVETLSDPKGWIDRTFSNIKDKLTEILNGGEKSDAVDTRQTPPYQDLCTPDVPFGYEGRSYNASVWASVEIVSMSSDLAVLSAKPLLEEYFMGHNDQNLTGNMTTPLRMRRPWPKNSYPGIDEKTFTFSLYLPTEWHTNTPKPLDERVVIRKEPVTRYFAKKFSSYTFSFRNFQELFTLEDLLNQRREQFVGNQFFVNVYDPNTKVINRLNEVMVLVKPSALKLTCNVTHANLKPIALNEPKYVQLCKNTTNYEARLYSRAVWVSTTVNSVSSQLAEYTALPLLDKYFDRYNDYGALIRKTEPVRLTMAWPTSTMNPIYSQDYTFSYFVPLDPNSSIPQPLDNKVKILDEPASTLFAMRFSGYTMDYLNILQLQELRFHLNQAGEEYVTSDPFAIEVYDKPSSFVVDRHNEVLVRIDPSVKQPKCVKKNFPPCVYKDRDCPSYRVVGTLKDTIEHRHLAGTQYVMKRTRTCNISQAIDDAYMPLYRYFTKGANSESEIMNRTTMDMFLLHKSRDNPPQGCDFTYSLLFHLPADRQLSAPEPTEDGVELIKQEARELFVITFTNSTTDRVLAAKETELRNELNKRDLCYSSTESFFASYDAAWTPEPHRKEIWIPVENCTTTSVQAPGYTILDRGCGEGVNCPSYEKGQSYGSFEERNYDESTWICMTTVSCNAEQAFNQSIMSLYRYFTGSYDIQPEARPIISYMKIADLLSTRCDKEIKTCAYLPETAFRLPLLTPPDRMSLLNVPSDDHPWQAAYVTTLQGSPTVTNIQSSITTLLQQIMDADLFHSGRVFVARYTLPSEDGQQHIEVGALTDTISYDV
ncbi:uncharacterized protein [Asterias amurensis]|uniref:uncharacterized protein n=1 Tax=Asterias amurensis TaxID=7602 RepID=UPI003AB3D2A9